MQKLLNDDVKDATLYSQYKSVYMQKLNDRRIRRNDSYMNHITVQYPIYPNVSLLDLQNQKQKLILKNDTNPSPQIETKIQEIQSKIDNQDYCVEGTPEWTTRQEFLAYAANFQWPDANELAIRQQEEADLLALLEN